MIRRIHSGGEFEKKGAYCRAVVAGGFVHVAGTVGQGEDVVAQCRSSLSIIEKALTEAGASFADVVRVHYILPDRHEFPACWPVLPEQGAGPVVRRKRLSLQHASVRLLRDPIRDRRATR